VLKLKLTPSPNLNSQCQELHDNNNPVSHQFFETYQWYGGPDAVWWVWDWTPDPSYGDLGSLPWGDKK